MSEAGRHRADGRRRPLPSKDAHRPRPYAPDSTGAADAIGAAEVVDPDAPAVDQATEYVLGPGHGVDASKPKQVRRRTMRGMLLMGGSTAGQALLQVVFLSLLARAVAPKEFGLVSGALIAVYFTTVLAESGVGVAIVQRATLTREHVRVGWTLSVALGVICWALLAVFAPQIEELLRLHGLTPILRVLALIFVINNLTLSDYLLSRRLAFGKLAAAELAAYAFGYGGVAVTMAYLGYGPWAIVGGQLAQSTLRTILVTCLAPFPYRPSLARGPMRELLNFGGGYTIGRFAMWLGTQVDTLVVGRYLGPAALGLYGRAYQLVQIPANLFGQVSNEVLFPAMAAVQDRQETLQRVFRVGVSFLALLALPCSVLAAVTSHDLVLVVLGRDWLPLRAAFDIIIFGLLFRTSTKLTDALMKARGAVYRRAWRSIVYAVAVFVGAFIGQNWGLHGVATGVLIALGLNYALTNYLCIVLVGMTTRQFLAAHLPAVICCAVAAAAGLGAQAALAELHVEVAARLVIVWLVAVAAVLFVIRVSWRLRILRSIVTLVVTLQSLMDGRVRRVLKRALGPGFAEASRATAEPVRSASPLAQ